MKNDKNYFYKLNESQDGSSMNKQKPYGVKDLVTKLAFGQNHANEVEKNMKKHNLRHSKLILYSRGYNEVEAKAQQLMRTLSRHNCK